MIDKKTAALIERLKGKTVAKEAVWQKTARETEFGLTLNSGRVTCDHWFHQAVEVADFRIFNAAGANISTTTAAAGTPDFDKKISLYSAIENQLFKIEETIDSEGPVGASSS